jgi:DNA polymerase
MAKTLEKLWDEWSTCTRCELGQRRQEVGGHFVAGEGQERGVLFVGEGPGTEEEQTGRPFVGRSGQVLRQALSKIGLDHYYLTNLVACRSCEPVLDRQTGEVLLKEDRRTGRKLPMIVDKPPPPLSIVACRERLLEEIYLVDPILIVTLGAEAAEAVLGRTVSITRERGVPEQIEIPGRLFRPSLTDKKKTWLRKTQGLLRAPVERSGVTYLVLPTIHPAFVLRRGADQGTLSPAAQFGKDLRRARDVYDRYLVEVLHQEPRQYNADQQEGEIDALPED